MTCPDTLVVYRGERHGVTDNMDVRAFIADWMRDRFDGKPLQTRASSRTAGPGRKPSDRSSERSMWARAINLPGLITIAAVLAGWEIAVRGGAVTFDCLPSPSAIAAAMAGLARSGQLFVDTARTLRSVLIGWGVAGVLGIGLGLLLGFSAFTPRYGLATRRGVKRKAKFPAACFAHLQFLARDRACDHHLSGAVAGHDQHHGRRDRRGGAACTTSAARLVSRACRRCAKCIFPAAAPSILVGARLSLGVALVMAVIAECSATRRGWDTRSSARCRRSSPRRCSPLCSWSGPRASRSTPRKSGREPLGVSGAFGRMERHGGGSEQRASFGALLAPPAGDTWARAPRSVACRRVAGVRAGGSPYFPPPSHWWAYGRRPRQPRPAVSRDRRDALDLRL